jgi:MOSC domain-containing protein
MSLMAKIHAIYRYPIKGLSAEPLYCATLTPGDRLYTIENGRSGFDAAAPVYLSKAHFLMLMKNERLARLRTAFDQASYFLTILYGGREVSGDLRTKEGPAAIKSFFAIVLGTAAQIVSIFLPAAR